MKFTLLDYDYGEDLLGFQRPSKRARLTSSSTSHTSEGKGNSKQLKRKAHRLSRAITTGVMEKSDITLLEHAAIGAQSRKYYAQEMEGFKKYAEPRGLDFKDASLLDRLLVEYLNRLFLKGFQGYKGDRVP